MPLNPDLPEPPLLLASNLHNPHLRLAIVAILVKRLGGSTRITQADFDDVAFDRLAEEGKDDGSLEFKLLRGGIKS